MSPVTNVEEGYWGKERVREKGEGDKEGEDQQNQTLFEKQCNEP